MKRLYRIDAFWYIMAEDDQSAVSIKPDWGAIDLEAILARDSGVDMGWWNALPFNGDDSRTCGEIQHDITPSIPNQEGMR